MSVNIDDFTKQAECVYKNENYSVRDNGAVLRHARQNKSLRKLDNVWIFGTLSYNGYLLIASEVVHRIVAYAFHGEPPTPQHVVDHFDTNRQNNRPENLRWLTKLENILNNPITLNKIVFHCGSIEAFLKDPSILKNFMSDEPNFGWMCKVTPEEAKISLERLNNWAKKDSNKNNTKNSDLGKWLFQSNETLVLTKVESKLVVSKTPNAIQKNWKNPCEFPACPQTINGNPIISYNNNLKIGEVFSQNQSSTSIIEDFAISDDKSSLWILSKYSDNKALKPWTVCLVNFENNVLVHESLGSFFKEDGAQKKFTLAQGKTWTHGDTFDDNVL